MLRDKNLVPLSRQHQHALALCVRIARGRGRVSLEEWQAEIEEQQRTEIELHFQVEEKFIFPEARRVESMRELVEELIRQHATLRALFAKACARSMTEPELREFARQLSAHIRLEERELFEALPREVSPATMARMGAEIEAALAAAPQVCVTPKRKD